jgi:amidase
LGGLPVDARVSVALEPGRRVLSDLGASVEDAHPDLRAADEVFRVLRAWQFELSFGALLDSHRSQLKDTVIWNIEEGRKLSGPDVGRAELERTQLYHRVREFMEQYAFLAVPVVQVPPFDVDQPYVTEINGRKLTTYLDWMRSCYWISATGLPAISVPCGFTPEGLPVGLQIVGRHQDDFGVLQLAYAFQRSNPLWQRRPPAATN